MVGANKDKHGDYLMRLDLTGQWYDKKNPGYGLCLIEHNSKIAGQFFSHYEDSTTPLWFVVTKNDRVHPEEDYPFLTVFDVWKVTSQCTPPCRPPLDELIGTMRVNPFPTIPELGADWPESLSIEFSVPIQHVYISNFSPSSPDTTFFRKFVFTRGL